MSDSNRGGWVKAYRKRWKHPLFRSYQEAAIWAWMCDVAAYGTRTISTTFGPVELRRGDILIQERTLAGEFGLSRRQVRRVLNGLETEQMAVPQTNRCPRRLGTVWKIVNYNKYQDISAQRQLALDGKTNGGRAGNEPQNGPETDRNRTTREEGKRKSNAGPDGTGASADPVKALFDIGVEILTAAGRSENNARSLVGKWRKQVGDEKLASIMVAARSKTDPVGYVTKAVNNSTKRGEGKPHPNAEGMLNDARVEGFRRTGKWDDSWGPRPVEASGDAAA